MVDDKDEAPVDGAGGADEGGKAEKGAKAKAGVDPIEAAAAKAREEAAKATDGRRKSEDFLKSLSPEQRKEVESLTSRAVNEALKSKAESGEYLPRTEFERELKAALKRERDDARAEMAAKEAMVLHLAEFEIPPGSEAYKKFTTEMNSGNYNLANIGKRELIERIARNAEVGKFAPKKPVTADMPYSLGGGEVSIRVSEKGDGKIEITGKDPVLADAEAFLKEATSGR